MTSPARLGRTQVRVLIAAVLIVLGVAALALNLASGEEDANALTSGMLSRLYPGRDLAVVDGPVAAAARRAEGDAERYLATHPIRDDRAFLQFAVTRVGPPPGAAATRRELAQLHRIGDHRTASGAAAARWLEAQGKKAVWKLYLKQYKQQATPASAASAKATLKRTLTLASELVTAAKSRYRRVTPYQVDPTLRALNQARFSTGRKFSYPSKHSVIAVAAQDVLARYEPRRAGEFRWMADEIDFSRLYGGGHYLSDITAGAYLGTLLARYELGSRS